MTLSRISQRCFCDYARDIAKEIKKLNVAKEIALVRAFKILKLLSHSPETLDAKTEIYVSYSFGKKKQQIMEP